MSDSANTPKVSVILTTYNRAKFLREAIQSVLNQEFTEFELLICDNASPDETEQVVRSFTDHRIRYFRHPSNIGAFGNGKFGLARARGQYVTVFHDDDVMGPAHLAEAVRVLDEHPNVGFVHCKYNYINGDGVQIPGLGYPADHDEDFIADGHSYFERLVAKGNCVCCPTVVARRECHERLGPPDERLPCTNDYELWMRWSLFYDVAYLKAPNFQYRWHGQNDYANYRETVNGHVQWYLARKYVISKHPDKIPDGKALLARVSRPCAREALSVAYFRCIAGRRKEALRYAGFALKISPQCVFDPCMRSFAARLVLGKFRFPIDMAKWFARMVRTTFDVSTSGRVC